MGLNVKGFILTDSKTEQQPPVVERTSKSLIDIINSANRKDKEVKVEVNESSLIVKKNSKKSDYLLDMLTSEEQ